MYGSIRKGVELQSLLHIMNIKDIMYRLSCDNIVFLYMIKEVKGIVYTDIFQLKKFIHIIIIYMML